jgi:hypothetical protein
VTPIEEARAAVSGGGKRVRVVIWSVTVAVALVTWATSYMLDRSSRYYGGNALENLVERPAERYDRISSSLAAARSMVYLDRVETGNWGILLEAGRLAGLRRGDTTVPLRSIAVLMGAPAPDRPVKAYLADGVELAADRFRYRLEGTGEPVLAIPIDHDNCIRVLWSMAMDPLVSKRVETTLDTGDLVPASKRVWHSIRPVEKPLNGVSQVTDQECPSYSFDIPNRAMPMADRLLVRLRDAE